MELNKAFEWIIQSSDCILDIGAFDGDVSIRFSRIAGKHGRIYSFEPHPIHFSSLSLAIAKLNINNIFPYCKAMSGKTGHCFLYSAMDVKSIHSMASTTLENLVNPKVHGENHIKFKVETDTIDNFCITNKVVPHFIKIDVEGAEAQVIRGGHTIIEKYLPIIVYEAGIDDFSHSIYLEQLGYRLFIVDLYYLHDKEVPKEHPVNQDGIYPITSRNMSILPSICSNILAMHPDHHSQVPILTKISNQNLNDLLSI